MKFSSLQSAIATPALVFLFAFAVTPAHAGNKAQTPPPAVDPRILIQSVDASSSTIVVQYMRDKTTHAYTLDDITVVTVNNSPGKFSDIKEIGRAHV